MQKLFLIIILIFVITSCESPNKQLAKLNSTIEIDADDSKDSIIYKAAHIIPTVNQYEALKNEFIAFIHFGPNTFTRMEWGNGMEDPKIFNLKNLDTDQWCRAMKEAGIKMVIFTAKHHDGFVLWQSRYTKQGVMSSSFKDGKGDVLKELSESCQRFDIKLAIYLSPADLYQIEHPEGLYGNLSKYTDRTIPRQVEGRPFANKTIFNFKVDDYNEYFLNQLFELLTDYGPVHEVWFDGAHPKRKGGQTYNYKAWEELISTLAPEAVIFGRQDIRWCGNESGNTRDTEWNVIPYIGDPAEKESTFDYGGDNIGSRENLYKSEYLHYQQAETNTSIREGWFYRDEDTQKVRSADDVFDMYERSVGGNSTFLLNIPPNRDGLLSPEDVKVLEEVGKRIKETYTNNLFSKAKGPDNVLDNDIASFELLESDNKEIIIALNENITINRLAIQEAIATHSERVEKHALDAWVNDDWQEIALATNVGYKRILRFPEITSNKFRIRILESRLNPAISNITAHYYKTRPPQLSISRSIEGLLKIEPQKHEFNWKPHGEDIISNINSGYEIRFTTNGSNPTKDSQLFKKNILVGSTEIKAVAIDKDELGSVASHTFGILKKDWKIMDVDSNKGKVKLAFDENANTYWQSKSSKKLHYLAIDLGENYNLKGFSYTPQKEHSKGMIEKGLIQISTNGKNWEDVEEFEFGNLINDPVKRSHYFEKSIHTRYVRIMSKTIAGNNETAAVAELDFF